MNKYRVLKSYPKQITNSGRLVTLKQGKSVYLKRESQVLRLVRLGFIRLVVDLPSRKKAQAKPAVESQPKVKEEASKSENKNKNKGQ